MRVRRWGLVTVVVLALAGLIAFGTEAAQPGASTFAELPPPGMPFAPASEAITSSWFCPGIPATPKRGGDVIITNPGSVSIRGRMTVYSTTRKVLTQAVQVGARDSASYALEKLASGEYLSALVELDGGGGLVEQRVRHPNGRSISGCSNAPSNEWFIVDGITLRAGYDLVITNPFPDYTNISVSVLTADGRRTPAKLQSQTMAGSSILKIDLEQYGLRDEQLLSVQVKSSPERVVVGRAQNYYGGLGRNGYSMTLGAPSPDSTWYFPDGEKSSGVSESLSILNPTDEPATVSVQVFTAAEGVDALVSVQTIEIAEGSVEKFDVDAIADLPPGRHSLVVEAGNTAVVAEQVITRGSGGGAVTSVSMGARVATTKWWVPTPLQDAGAGTLTVLNATGLDGTFTVYALGPGGLLAVPGFEKVSLAAAIDFVGGAVDLDLSSASVVGLPVLIEATVDVVVLRRPQRGPSLKGRSVALALPEL